MPSSTAYRSIMSGMGSVSRMSALVVMALTAFLLVACGSSATKKSLDQQFNDEVAVLDINLGTPRQSPTFEFSIDQHPPRFTVILCNGARDDSRMQKDAWSIFLNEVLKYGPAQSYKLDFIDVGSVVDDKSFIRTTMLVKLHEGADTSIAQDVGHKVVKVMKEFSPCR